MLNFTPHSAKTLRTVLLLGAHCDDLEIGCGGTIMTLIERCPQTEFVWVTLSSDALRAAETHAAAAALLAGAAKTSLRVEAFRGSYFPQEYAEIKDYFEEIKRTVQPDLILTHCRGDLHQDHRVVNELTWNTFRNHCILEYEIPKFDGDLGQPNAFVALSRQQLQRKCKILMECFPSQAARSWFSQDTFEAIARLRGIESNAPDGFAEGFYARKTLLAFGAPG